MTNEVKPIKIRGTAFRASLNKVNQMSGQYQIDIGELSDAAVKALETLGVEARHKEGQGFYITCKSKWPIKAYDTNKDEIDEIVGNGSKVEAVIGSFSWKFKNKAGVSPTLKALVIKELKRYDPEVAEVMDDEEAL